MTRDESGQHPAMTSGVRWALLTGGRITAVESHKGEPGGPNNDRITLQMESGDRVVLDIYSLYPLAVELEKAS